ncbi:hypothetical protein GGTG_01435 [Gaeumannomyces tritici R3-111a-1]|uniref:Uncharacterized protein n=1 Tax=Gaeumannomyces tritici (strain R3-111a-1) TaxID=644352 RepID=J3NJK4_GAET3|nr:hypothetical protein GGTG_01435 [Gaeumannomyces tritici R3-111a-1]EJT81456.1 hypothetical protein GGTG_01435 [Gaeumannomyces tritici R3-111a-1]
MKVAVIGSPPAHQPWDSKGTGPAKLVGPRERCNVVDLWASFVGPFHLSGHQEGAPFETRLACYGDDLKMGPSKTACHGNQGPLPTESKCRRAKKIATHEV